MSKVHRITAVALSIGLVGCAIQQHVRPVEAIADRQICVIDNPAVRASFVEAYKRSLTGKGYEVRQVPASTPITGCGTTSTYSANWRWDLAMYMAYAEIRVFSGGKQVGDAKYDSMGGGANMNKFIDADRKIQELVDQMFPGGARK